MINQALSFVAVVKAGSFSSAAKNIGVSKAQLSRQIKQLEVELGIQLLYRTTRSITLTESGKQFFQSCQAIEETYDEAVDNLKQDYAGLRGTLRITAPIDFGIKFLPVFINQVRKKYPNINVALALSNINEDLIGKNYDLAFRIATTLPDSSLRMRQIIEFKRILCASPGYFKDKEQPKNLEDLKSHPCITSVNYSARVIKPQWQFEQNNEIINYTPNSVIEVDSLTAQIELISLGAGIGRIPDYLIEKELKSGHFIEVLPKLKKPSSQVYLLYPNRSALPKKTQVFMTLLKEEMHAGRFPLK